MKNDKNHDTVERERERERATIYTTERTINYK